VNRKSDLGMETGLFYLPLTVYYSQVALSAPSSEISLTPCFSEVTRRDTLLRQAFQRLNRETVETGGPRDVLSAVTSLKRGANGD
jgi:hypothetical protein